MNRKPDPYGRNSTRPYHIPLKGWWQVAQRVWTESSRDNLSVVAAGCAFFALFAIFPALSTVDMYEPSGHSYRSETISMECRHEAGTERNPAEEARP